MGEEPCSSENVGVTSRLDSLANMNACSLHHLTAPILSSSLVH